MIVILKLFPTVIPNTHPRHIPFKGLPPWINRLSRNTVFNLLDRGNNSRGISPYYGSGLNILCNNSTCGNQGIRGNINTRKKQTPRRNNGKAMNYHTHLLF